tara:strand:- start:1303 stop:2223 length:921 start_codon:yes stop_codon:yes gene_type:complete
MFKNDKLIGHNNTFKNLIDLFNKNSLPNKILLSGKKGIGKSILAEHLINYIYSLSENDKYDIDNLIINKNNRSNILYNNNSHPNIFKIIKNDEKKKIEISQIREMIDFQNKSSFNNKIKTIIIDEINYLNLNSTNALLKSLEEPKQGTLFILINNSDEYISDTIKSRCIEFKLFINFEETTLIVNNYYQENIIKNISHDFLNYYNSPSFFISLIKFMKENNIDYNTATIEDLLIFLIKNKLYMTNKFIVQNLNNFIELFFYKNINHKKNNSHIIKEYFYFKLKQIQKYNLDFESFFLEFQDRLLSE